MRRDFQPIVAQLTHPSLYDLDGALSAAIVQNCCVRAVGATEGAIRLAIRTYCQRRSCAEVSSYVSRQLAGFYNPKASKIEELLGSFSGFWAEEFRVFAKGEIKDALDSLVENKNRIAHSEPSGIGVATLRPWVTSAIKACDFVDALVV